MYQLYDWKITAKLQITGISNGLQGYLRRITMRVYATMHRIRLQHVKLKVRTL